MTTPPVQRIPWPDFIATMQWRQSEHVALIGPTGSGKTSLAYWLLPQRKFIVILATKPRDPSLSRFAKTQGFQTFSSWPNRAPAKTPRRLIWPKSTDLDSLVNIQQKVFLQSLNYIYAMGGWCIYIDELWWFAHVLGLSRQVKILLQQARSMNISIVVGTQRPAWVPLEVYDQSTHLFLWRDTDSRNLQRLAGISWINADAIVKTIARLPEWHVLYVNTRTGVMIVTRPPAPNMKGGETQ